MMAGIEDLRLLVRRMCGAVGISGAAANVVSLVVLGLALNVAALTIVRSVRTEGQPTCGKTALRFAAQTDFKAMRTVVTSTMKKFRDGQLRWCLTECDVGSLQKAIENFANGDRTV